MYRCVAGSGKGSSVGSVFRNESNVVLGALWQRIRVAAVGARTHACKNIRIRVRALRAAQVTTALSTACATRSLTEARRRPFQKQVLVQRERVAFAVLRPHSQDRRPLWARCTLGLAVALLRCSAAHNTASSQGLPCVDPVLRH
jgi:hypothetical protein